MDREHCGLTMKISDLAGNPENPRSITDAKKAMLAKALKRFGDLSGIVYNVETKHLVGGHQRINSFDPSDAIIVLKRYSKATAQGTVLEGYIETKNGRFSYRQVMWDETTEKAANIAANAGAGEWDTEKLQAWIDDLSSFDLNFDLDLTMFDSKDFEELGINIGEEEVFEGECDEDEIPAGVDSVCKIGQLWKLGEHRLMCGDSTDLANVEKLMNGEKADICFTSPPYNVALSHTKIERNKPSHQAQKYQNYDDDLSLDDYKKLISKSLQNMQVISKYQLINIQHLAGNKIALIEWIYNFRIKFVDTLIWFKYHGVPQRAEKCLNSAFEYIYIFSADDKPSKAIKSANFRNIDNVYVAKRQTANEFSKVHAATFPVHLPEFISNNFCPVSGSVVDLFGGTGTTMIACEKTNRKCFMMELDPHYCDLIIARWEKFTGKTAKLIKHGGTSKRTSNGKSKSKASA